MTNEQPRLTIDKRSPALWVVTFANPPINLIDTAMIGELQHLLTAGSRNYTDSCHRTEISLSWTR